MGSEDHKIDALKKRGKIQGLDLDERKRGARDEDAELVDGVVGRVEGTVLFERSFVQGEEKSGRDALVDGILGHVDKEEG